MFTKDYLKKYLKENQTNKKIDSLILDWFDLTHWFPSEIDLENHSILLDKKSDYINKITLMNDSFYVFLFTTKTRLAFAEKEEINTLYELILDPKFSITPRLRLFRKNKEKFYLSLFSDKENTEIQDSTHIFFKNSIGQVKMKVLSTQNDFDLWLKNRYEKTLLTFSSVDNNEDIEMQLMHFLQLYISYSEDQIFQQKAIDKITELLQNLSSLPLENKLRSKLSKTIRANDHLMQSLRDFRNLDGPFSQKVRGFIKEISQNRDSLFITNNIEIKNANLDVERELHKIPLLIDRVAEEFCLKNSITEHFTFPNTFVELQIDQEDDKIDYNTAKLILDFSNQEKKEEVIVGLKVNDLGFGFPIVRLLIIGNKGSITLKECAKINAAIKYAVENKIPIDWFACSFGVEISLNRGVEGLDASSSTARELLKASRNSNIPINVVVDNANVGAQAYWDAIASILFDTNGLLIMTEKGSMTLTGYKALTLALQSKTHSLDITETADKLFPQGLQSLGGYENVYSASGEAMLYAKNLKQACEQLLLHHYYSYTPSADNLVENRILYNAKKTILSETDVEKEIKKIRDGRKGDREKILMFLHNPNSPPPLYLWKDIKGETENEIVEMEHTIVAEMIIGNRPTMVIFPPTGPLSPQDAALIAKAIYKANNRIPVLIIGNLTGFNSDPEAMKHMQLFSGASIVKSIVEHEGPILVTNLGNLVGGTYVIFSKQLNPNLKILAIEGAKFQVVGGVLAAKLIFHKTVMEKAQKDSRLQNLSGSEYDNMLRKLITEFEGIEAENYDKYHSAYRALSVNSIDKIVPIRELRDSIVAMQEQSINEYLEKKCQENQKLA